MTKALDVVGIYAIAHFRFFNIYLAEELKARHGSRVHLYCPFPEQKAFYEEHNKNGVFDSIVVVEQFPGEFGQNLNEEEVRQRGREMELRYGRTIAQLSVANRHLGRGYAPGGYHHPRSSQSENSSFVQVIDYYTRRMEYWAEEFTSKGMTCLIGAVLPEVVNVAHYYGVRVRNPMQIRYKNFYHWTIDEFETDPLLDAAYHDLPLPDSQVSEIEAPPFGHLDTRNRILAVTKVSGLVKKIVLVVARFAYWRLRGYTKARNYRLGSTLAYFLRIFRDARKVMGTATLTLKDLAGKKFLFFPLQVEPERSLQGISPEYLSQLAAIVSLSRDLPADTVLVVKEHVTALGRRPDRFYEQIGELKNVVKLDVREHGRQVIKEATAVATITGSAGLEAACMGKPVISFGRHNVYNIIPHVMVVTDETQLAGYLSKALDGSIDSGRAIQEGARYLQAAKRVSVDVGDFSEYEVGRIDPGVVAAACDALERSMEIPLKAASAQ